MTIKVTVLVVLVSTICRSAPVYSGLLRTPKVYNAVITTDENLTPSRAYPVVQPVVHEAGLTYPFGAFGPFGLYNTFNHFPGFYQPQAAPGTNAAHVQGRNSFYTNREPEPQLQDTPIETLPGAKPIPETNLPLREAPTPELIPEPNNSIAPKAPEGPRPNYEARPADPKQPLQLNEFGLPPSLIPLQNYNPNGQNQQPTYSVPGYPYNFPVLYDSFGNYNPTQYQSVLPPFGYFPQLAQPNPYFTHNIAPNGPASNAVDPQQVNRAGREQELQEDAKAELQDGTPSSNSEEEGVPESNTTTAGAEADVPEGPKPEEGQKSESTPLEVEPIPDSIKNNANKSKDIPDVPPPPIPSGAKDTEQTK